MEMATAGRVDGGRDIAAKVNFFHAGVCIQTWDSREKGFRIRVTRPAEHRFRCTAFHDAPHRGLLRPGMAADITVFDPDTVRTLPEDVVHDFPAGGWRVRELSEGIKCTVVNGEVLIQDGQHTGALPGRVMRNALYNSNQS